MCACVSCRFWFLQWFRIVVVFLLGLYASARMTACCACLGVGFIVIPFFVFLRMHARVRVARWTFWIVTWCFLVAPATFLIILRVYVWRGAHFGS